jgi:hypothetical protein
MEEKNLIKKLSQWLKLTNSFSSNIIGNEYTLIVSKDIYSKITEQITASYVGVIKQLNQSTYEIAGNKVTIIVE